MCDVCFVPPVTFCCLFFVPRVQEVEELRQKLQEVEIGTALSQADSNFLQRELEDKEADIGKYIYHFFLCVLDRAFFAAGILLCSAYCAYLHNVKYFVSLN